jgi:hypothetical protein
MGVVLLLENILALFCVRNDKIDRDRILKTGDSPGNVGTMVSEPRKGLCISQQRVEKSRVQSGDDMKLNSPAGVAMQISSNKTETN